MIFINAFLFSGIVCLIGQVLLDNTKLTPGHITTIFTIIGALLSLLGVYDILIDKCGAGATVLIMNFGHMLFKGGIEGFNELGVLGIFSGLLTKSSLAIVSTIVFSFAFSLFFKPKD
jgi:stage V sporulation protein AE